MSATSDWLTLIMVALTALGVLATAITWSLRVERRLGETLSRSDHQMICEESREELRGAIDRLSAQLEERERQAQAYRDRAADKLDRLGRNIAVLQDRAGLYRFNEPET